MTTVSAAIKMSHRTKPIKSLDRIMHDIHNNLHVIRMETELRIIDPTTDEASDRIFAAIETIDNLLSELRECF